MTRKTSKPESAAERAQAYWNSLTPEKQESFRAQVRDRKKLNELTPASSYHETVDAVREVFAEHFAHRKEKK